MVIGKEIIEHLRLEDPANEYKDHRNCHLSILLQQDAMSVAKFHLPTKTHFFLAQYQTSIWSMERKQSIVDCIESVEEFKEDYHSVSLAVGGGQTTLIPDKVFDPAKLADYADMHSQIDGNKQLKHYSVKTHGCQAVFEIPPKVEEAFDSCFRQLKVMPVQVPYIDYWTRQIAPKIGQHIVLRFSPDRMELLAWKGTQLILCNTYSVSTPEDAIYFLLFVMEQLEFDTNLAPVIIQGGLEEDSKTFELIYKYVRNIYMGERPQHENYSFALDNISKSEYFGLFSQHTCV